MKRSVILVVSVVVLAGCYPEEWMDVSPDGRALVYSGGDAGVFWLTVDGKQSRRLGALGWNPKFAPDGRHCVFQEVKEVKPDGQRADLVVSDTTDGTKEVLRSWSGDDVGESLYVMPSWHPDGKEIAYVLWKFVKKEGEGSGEPDQQTELRVVDAGTGEDRLLFTNVGIHCRWSPDGKMLALFRSAPEGEYLGEQMLGTMEILDRETGEVKHTAGILFNPYADLAWLSNDRVIFVSAMLSLPASGRSKDDLQEAVHVYDLVTNSVAPIYETAGISWRQFSSCLRLSPDRRRVLYGTHDPSAKGPPSVDYGPSGKVSLWCYEFSRSRKVLLADSVADAYPFWLDDDRIGYFEGEGKVVIADIDDEGKVTGTRPLDLSEVLAPLLPSEAPGSQPAGTAPAE